jgi:hypothetical protein
MICHQVKVTIIRHFCGFAFVALKFALFACFLITWLKKTVGARKMTLLDLFFACGQ